MYTFTRMEKGDKLAVPIYLERKAMGSCIYLHMIRKADGIADFSPCSS